MQKNIDYFLVKIFIYGRAKKLDEKKVRRTSKHRRSHAKCQLLQTSCIKGMKLFAPRNKHLINRT